MKLLFISLFLIISNFSIQAQDIKLHEAIQDSIINQMGIYPQEKIHLHTDRDIYVPGEKIWFKAYVTDAYTHRFPVYSRYVYVELISPMDSLINRVMIRPENDMFFGHMFLSEFIPEGSYTIRAYTRYMENMGDEYFFKKNIHIKNLTKEKENDKNEKQQSKAKNDYDVSFFPEGGNLLEGVFCRVAFKALNNTGSSEPIKGKIVDETGKKISEVETIYAGMGSFALTAEKGKQYFLECQNGKGLKKRFKLPDAYENAYSLSTVLDDRRGDLYVTRNKATNSPDISQYLLIHSRGLVLFFLQWDKDKDLLVFKKDQISSGIIQILLLDENMDPLSERLVFNKTGDQIEVFFTTNKEVYEKRDLISSTIELSDSEGNIHSGNLSIAITDDKDVSMDSLNTITSSLLLSSELRGYIETPAFYLQDNRFASYALDHLMMTHGWRRYNIPEVIKGKMEIPKKPVEISQEISGLVRSLFLGKPIESTEVTMMSSAGGLLLTETNREGEFSFADFETVDSVSFFVQSLNKKGMPDVEVVVNEKKFPDYKHIPDLAGELVDSMEADKEEYGFIEKAEQRSRYDEDMLYVQLQEVVVTAKRPEKEGVSRSLNWISKSSEVTIKREEIEKRVVRDPRMFFRSLPDVQVDGDVVYFIRPAFGFSGRVPALLLLDGIVVDDLSNIPYTNEIESIDFFKSIGASVFGARGMGGAISITTRTGGDQQEDDRKMSNFATLSPLGYQEPAEFYSPKYNTLEAKYINNPDYRTTIFWKPNIVINEDGKALFEFYASDFATTYSVVIEGITNDGLIFRRIEKIKIK